MGDRDDPTRVAVDGDPFFFVATAP